MFTNSWPFSPILISNDRQLNGLEGEGIISQDDIKGRLTILAARLKYPCTIYESYQNKMERIDSILEENALEKSCQMFRAYCIFCETLHK